MCSNKFQTNCEKNIQRKKCPIGRLFVDWKAFNIKGKSSYQGNSSRKNPPSTFPEFERGESRVARFLLAQHTKTGKYTNMTSKYTK
jgi:hypothetical protein